MKIATQLAHPFEISEHQRLKKITQTSREKCKEPPNFSLVMLKSEDKKSTFSKFYGEKIFLTHNSVPSQTHIV